MQQNGTYGGRLLELSDFPFILSLAGVLERIELNESFDTSRDILAESALGDNGHVAEVDGVAPRKQGNGILCLQ